MTTVVLTAACNREDGKEDKITMVTIKLIYNGTITIDWGDISEKHTSSFLASTQTYINSSTRTITITGNGITQIDCSHQGILQLDVSKCPNLTRLQCGWNQLQSLDVSRNTALRGLDCYMNELKDLDISKNTELEYLNCHTNQLTNLDLRNNLKLWHLRFPGNQLTSEAIDATFGTLNNTIIEGSTKILYCSGNPGTYNCDRSIAENKGWSIMDVP